MDNRIVTIYTLTNPENNEVFYVGRTILALSRRMQSHTMKAECSRDYVIYLYELEKKGLKPIIEAVDECTWDNRKQVEEFWIQTFATWGFPLVNKRHIVNKNWYTQKEIQRKRQRSFVLKTVRPEVLDLIYLLYRPEDTEEISKRCGCTKERIRGMMDKYKRLRSNKIMEWVKPSIEQFYIEKGKLISETYIKTEIYAQPVINDSAICQN